MAREKYETLQDVFDDAYRGLAAQGFQQSLTKPVRNHLDPMRAFRGFDGNRCAIGHCIPDDIYDPAMEGASPRTNGETYPVARRVFDKLFAGIDADELARLQGAHDRGDTPDEMRMRLQTFATTAGLTIPSLAA